MTKEILKIARFDQGLEIIIDDRSTGQLCPDEVLGFIAHLLFKDYADRKYLYALSSKDLLHLPEPKDKALQEYLKLDGWSEEAKTVFVEINERLKSLEAANEKA